MNIFDNFRLREIGSEYLLIPINLERKKSLGYIHLNSTAAIFWKLLREGYTSQEIALLLSKNLSLNIDQVMIDISTFVKDIYKIESIICKNEITSHGKIDSLIDKLYVEGAKYSIPIKGTFELTQKCNMKCSMCYVHVDSSCSRKEKELSTTDWLKIAEQAVNEGLIFLTLTGGEIFSRQDFFEIYNCLINYGIFLVLFTNGTLIDKYKAKRLSEVPPSRMEITLYGASREVYERVTNAKGSYDLCCKGIQNILEQGIPVLLKTTLTSGNFHELNSMYQMANNWGVPIFVNWILTGRRDGRKSNIEVERITPSMGVSIELDKKYLNNNSEKLHSEKNNINKKTNFYCYAGSTSYFIDAYGAMNPCLDLTLPGAQTLKIGFKKAWQKTRKFVNNVNNLDNKCSSCSLISYCQQCPAWSFRETGTFSSPIPYLCEIAKLRKNSKKTNKSNVLRK